jgi:phenylacetate-coenzyme A ligase PaaK-like adenylate-forming protein
MNIGIMLRLLRMLEQLRKHERWTRQQLEAHQARALQDLRQYAYDRSPFYQKSHKGLTGSPLHGLPVLTKGTLMEHFDELVTDRSLRLEEVRTFAAQGDAGQRYKDRYWVNATSGSARSVVALASLASIGWTAALILSWRETKSTQL